MTTSDSSRDANGRRVPQRLLDAATTLFAEQGFERTSVQQIVSAAGVTKGAMYHYFASKDDLLVGTYSQLLDMQFDELERTVSRPGSVGERILEAAESVVRTTLEHIEDATVFYRSLHLLDQPARAAAREQRRRYRGMFEQLVREGIANGELRPDLAVELVTYNFFGAVMYLTVWYSPDGPRTVDEIAAAYASMLLNGLT